MIKTHKSNLFHDKGKGSKNAIIKSISKKIIAQMHRNLKCKIKKKNLKFT